MAVYSRNSENNTAKFPDLVNAVKGYVKPGVDSVVLDCEVVAFDHETQKIQPFQVRPFPQLLMLGCKIVASSYKVQKTQSFMTCVY